MSYEKARFGVITVLLLTLFFEALLRYFSLSTNVFDLGLFSNNLYNSQTEYQRGLSGHAHGFFALLALAYISLPSVIAPLFLIFIQWLTLSTAVFLVWRFWGFLPSLAMALYYPFWALGLFDFHFDCLIILILVIFFISCERQKFWWAALLAMSLVFVKEPFALQSASCGLYLYFLACRVANRDYRLQLISSGTLLVVWGFSWFYIYVHWILPYFGGSESGALGSPAFSWLGSNLVDIFLYILLHPVSLLQDIIHTPGKIKYLFVVFGSLGFIPFVSPGALIVAAPILLISLVSHLSNHYDYATHYTAGLIVPAIVAFRDGFSTVRVKFLTALPCQTVFYVITLVILFGSHWAFASSPISRLFWSDKVWSYSWQSYLPSARDLTLKAAMLTHVPVDRNLSVSSQNTVNWGHLAHRNLYLPFPLGVVSPHKVIDFSNRDFAGLWRYILTGYKPDLLAYETRVDYVVLDFKRPWFIVDAGCDWLYGACTNMQKAAEFLDLVALTRRRYDTVYNSDGFMILKRRP